MIFKYTGAVAGGEKGLSYRVLFDLITPNLFFFTGIDLADDLQERGTYTFGTIRMHRKGFPDDLKDPDLTKNLRRGNVHCFRCCKENDLHSLARY